MPAPVAKSKSTGSSGKGKTPASTNGTTTPVSTAPSEKKTISDASAPTAGGKPDKSKFDAEQQRLKTEIDALQLKLVGVSWVSPVKSLELNVHVCDQSAVRDKISLATKGGSGNEKRNALKAELDSIRDQQSSNKLSRGKILDQVKSYNESISKRVCIL